MSRAAVFDTKMKMPAVLSGRASRGIAKELRRHGVTLLTKPENFLVSKDNQLLPGEEDRARIGDSSWLVPSLALPIRANLRSRDRRLVAVAEREWTQFSKTPAADRRIR